MITITSEKELGIKTSIDIKDFERGIETIISKMSDIIDKIINLGVNVDDSQLEEVKYGLEELSDMVVDPTLTADDQLSEILDNLESQIRLVDQSTVDVVLNANDNASDIMEAVQEIGEKLDGEEVKVNLITDGGDETLELANEVQTRMSELDGMTSKVQIEAEGMDDVGTAADKASESVKGVGDAAKEASDEMIKAGEEGESAAGVIEDNFLAAEAAIAGVAIAAELAAQKMNSMSIDVGQLSIETGMSEEKMRELVTQISNATFPIEDAMLYMETLDQAGLASDELGHAATTLDIIRDATGLTNDEIIALVNSLKVMGADLTDLESTYGALAYAQNNVIGGLSTYIRWMTRFDSQFHELGLTIDQTAVAVAAATRKWGGGRAALSGLSQAFNEADGDITKFEEALGLTPGTLSRASTETNNYAGQIRSLAQEEVDHKTVLDESRQTVDELSLSYGGLLSPISSIVSFISSNIAVLVGFGYAVEKIFGVSLIKAVEIFLTKIGAMGWISETLVPTITGAWGSLVSALTGGGEAAAMEAAAMEASFSGVSTGVTDMAATTATASSMSIASIAALALAAIGGGTAMGHMANVVDDTLTSIGVGSSVITDLAGALWNMANIAGGPILSAFKALATAIYDLIWGGKSLGEVIPEYFENAFLGMKETSDRMFNYLGSLIGQIKKILTQWGVNLYNWARDAWNSFIQGIYSMFGSVNTALNDVYNIIMNGINWILNLPSTLYNMGANAINGLIKGIEDTIPGLSTALGWIRDYFPFSDARTGPLSDITSWGTSFGNTLKMSFSEGIEGFSEGTVDKLSDELISISDAVEPSAEEVGSNIVNSLSEGIDDNQETLENSMDDMQYTIVNQNTLMAGMGDDYEDTGKDLVDSLSDGIDDGVTPGLEDSVDDVGDTIEYPVANPEQTKENWKQLGLGLTGSLAQGLKDGTPQVTEALEGIGAQIEAQSPPREGPLRFLDQWGEQLGKLLIDSFSSGIIDSISTLESALSHINPSINATVSDFAIPEATLNAMNAQSTSMGAPVITIQGGINVTIGSVPSTKPAEVKEVGRIAGRAAGEELVDTVKNRMRVLGFKL